MAEGGPPALQLPPVCPPPVVPAMPPATPEQPTAPPEQPIMPPEQVQEPVQPAKVQVQLGQPPLNWSYFKPEVSGKPEEDEEVHLLRTND